MQRNVPSIAEMVLAEAADSVAIGREFAGKALMSWAYRGSHDDVVLVVSELITNALLHGLGSPVLRLSGTRERVRIEVGDDSSVLPAQRPAGETGGWGLRVVARLAAAWGVARHPPGKVVWCELAAG